MYTLTLNLFWGLVLEVRCYLMIEGQMSSAGDGSVELHGDVI